MLSIEPLLGTYFNKPLLESVYSGTICPSVKMIFILITSLLQKEIVFVHPLPPLSFHCSTGRVKARDVRRLYQLHHWRHRLAKIVQAASPAVQVVCVRSTGRVLQTQGVCPRSLYKGYHSFSWPFKCVAKRGKSSHTGRVKARGVRRLHKLHYRRHGWCAPGARGLSKGSRRVEIALAASSVAQVVCLPPEYDITLQTHFEREDCTLADIWPVMLKIYADSLARSNSNSSSGIVGLDVAMQAMGRDLSNACIQYCKNFGHYKNECADFKVVRPQNQRRRQRQHKQRGGHQPHQPKPGGEKWQGDGGKCGAHTTRPSPTVTTIAAPGRQTGPTAMPTSPKSVLRVFLGSARLVGSSCARRLRKEALHLLLGQRGLACNQARRSPNRGGKRDMAIRTSTASSD